MTGRCSSSSCGTGTTPSTRRSCRSTTRTGSGQCSDGGSRLHRRLHDDVLETSSSSPRSAVRFLPRPARPGQSAHGGLQADRPVRGNAVMPLASSVSRTAVTAVGESSASSAASSVPRYSADSATPEVVRDTAPSRSDTQVRWPTTGAKRLMSSTARAAARSKAPAESGSHARTLRSRRGGRRLRPAPP